MKGLPLEILNATSYRMLATPRVVRRSSLLILLAFAVLIGVLIFTPWQQTAVGNGRVIAFAPGDRVQSITANVEGRIEKWFVREGDTVQEGALIAKMADNDPAILERLQSEREALQRRISLLELNVKLAGKNRVRQKALSDKEWSSELSVEQAQVAELRAQQELADAEGQLARLDTNIARQMTLEIRAPKDGIVQTILTGENNGLVRSGAVIAQLVPLTSQRTVELFVNGIDMPFIKIGQDVRLQFEGWPILQFAGLPQLATGTFSGTVKIIDASDDGRGNFRIIVDKKPDSPWPAPELLRQGVRARGWVQMNQVPVWFEIWRLINDLPPFEVPLSVPTGQTPPAGPARSGP